MLHHVLSSHPDIFFPTAPQEIHFFDVEENYRKGMAWYSNLFREWNGQRVIAQTSPLYLFEATVPARIHRVVPEARFLVTLRNPIDRAYSHYWHAVKHGAERLTFEAALDREPDRLLGGFEARRHFSYAARGAYATQLERYLEFFPRDRFMAIRFEDLTRDLEKVLSDCASFLGVPSEGFDGARKDTGARNTARMPRSRVLHSIGRVLGGGFPALRDAIGRVNLKPTSYPPLSTETRKTLARRFESEILRTAQITGLDLSSWLE